MESFLLLLVLVALFTAGVSYSRASHLSRRIAAMEQYLATEQEPLTAPVAVSSTAQTRTTTAAGESMGADIRKPRPHVESPPVETPLQNQPILEPPPPNRPSLEPVVQRIRSTEEWETLIGGRWMNRIGALALILGIGFFLKYAFDNNWISQGLRVVIGLAIGVGLLALAHRAHCRDLAIFAQGLVGAGIASLYLSVYAASNFYHLISFPVALAGMGVVTGLTLQQSLTYDSRAVALLGWVGGFLSIPLLGISTGYELDLVAYLILLNAAFLGLVLARDQWAVLEPLAMSGTYLTYAGWYLSSYQSSQLGLAAIALTGFWVEFLAVDAVRLARRVASFRTLREWVGVLNPLIYFGALLALLHDQTVLMGGITVLIGALYLTTILLVNQRPGVVARVNARYTQTALLFAVLAVPVLTSDFTMVVLWAAESLVFLWCGARWNLWYVWRPALVVYALTVAALIVIPGAFEFGPIRTFTPLFNQRALAFLVVVAAIAAGSITVQRLQSRYLGTIIATFHYVWTTILFLLISVEINDRWLRAMIGTYGLDHLHLEYVRTLVLVLAWMTYSLILVGFALQRRIVPILLTGLAAAGLAVGVGLGIGSAYQPIERFAPVLNVRALTVLLLVAGATIQQLILRRNRELFPWVRTAVAAFQGAAGLLIFVLFTAEIHDYFRHSVGAISENGGGNGHFVELMVLAAVWMLYSLPLVRYGARNRSTIMLVVGLGSAGLSVVAGAVAALVFVPDTWLSLALTLRPTVLLFLVLVLFVHTGRLREDPGSVRWFDVILVALQACMVLLVFELISTQTRDFFTYQIQNASTSGDARTLGDLEQLTLSLTWLAYAIVLMGVGLWRRTRWIRLASLALLGFIILKIFAYDLSFLSPAYRSISFAGLGVILLGVSFAYQRYRTLLVS